MIPPDKLRSVVDEFLHGWDVIVRASFDSTLHPTQDEAREGRAQCPHWINM
jgi:hypothetical protein